MGKFSTVSGHAGLDSRVTIWCRGAIQNSVEDYMNTLMHQKTDTNIKLITSNKTKPSKIIGLQEAPIKNNFL